MGLAIRCCFLCWADYRCCLIAPVAPRRAPHFSLFAQSKVSKRKRPPGIRVSLRETPLAPVPLRRHAPKRHPWRIGAFSASCLETCCATPALGLLTRMVRPPKLCISTQLTTTTQSNARTDIPVRRVSGIGVQGVERHGCRERHDGPGMALRDVPLERRWSERTPSAQRLGPYVGCVSSWLLLLAA